MIYFFKFVKDFGKFIYFLRIKFGPRVRPKTVFDWLRACIPRTQWSKTQGPFGWSGCLPFYGPPAGYFRWCGFL